MMLYCFAWSVGHVNSTREEEKLRMEPTQGRERESRGAAVGISEIERQEARAQNSIPPSGARHRAQQRSVNPSAAQLQDQVGASQRLPLRHSNLAIACYFSFQQSIGQPRRPHSHGLASGAGARSFPFRFRFCLAQFALGLFFFVQFVAAGMARYVCQ